MRKILFFIFVFVFLCTWNVSAEAADTKVVKVAVEYEQTEARKMLSLVNSFRQGSEAWYWNEDNRTQTVCSDLSGLVYDYQLERIAMQRAAEIALSFDHTRPDGSKFYSAYPSGYMYCAENIAMGYSSAEATFKQWKEDAERYEGQGHRRNMLSKSAGAIGIGHVVYNGRHYWVQEFGNRAMDIAGDSAVDQEKNVEVTIANWLVSSLTPVKNVKFSLANGSTMTLPDADMLLVMHDSVFGYACPVQIPTKWTVKDIGIASVSDHILTAKGIGTTTLSNDAWGANVVATVEVYCAHNEIVDPAVLATCEQPGLTEGKHCDKCGKILVKQKEVAATGHTWNQGKITVAPTEDQTGEKVFTCTICKAERKETLPAIEKPVSNVLKVGTIIEGKDKAQYIVTKSSKTAGEVAYRKMTDKSVKKVVVPDAIRVNGIVYKVTSVSTGACKSLSKVQSLVIGKNVKKIEKDAFRGCKNLKSVKITSTKISSIGAHAFLKVSKKVKYKVPSSKKSKYISMLKKASK